MTLEKALSRIEAFRGPNLAQRMAAIEASLRLLPQPQVDSLLVKHSINRDLVTSVASVKRASAQIDVILHAVGILISLPSILEPGEVIDAASLGAGNTSGDFDLETGRRVAEFKFITWQGSGDAVRKKTLFEDFVKLALYQGPKRCNIYLLGLRVAQDFLNGQSSIDRILDRNARLHRRFREAFGPTYSTVGPFFRDFRTKIEMFDLQTIVPELRLLDSDTALLE